MESRPAPWIAALGESYELLRSYFDRLDAKAIEGPSYASEWSVAKVLSHIGSGAQIFSLFLDAGLHGEDPPGSEVLKGIWGEWDSKHPQEQARDALESDRRLVEQFASLDAQQLTRIHLDLLGMKRDIAGLAALRLGEHALHTWDIIVVGEPDAVVAPNSVALLIDTLGQTVERVAKPDGTSRHVFVSTSHPDRRLLLTTGEAVTLGPTSGEALRFPSGTSHDDGIEREHGDAQLCLPAEALVRLVYGRLDLQHTPPVDAQSVTLSELRSIFPGF